MSDPESENTTSEIGYKKVPKHAQFKPGQSGNPKGPAKKIKPATLSEAIAQELHKLHTLKGPGRRQRRSAKEVMVRQLVEDAANEDLQAFMALIGLLEEHGRNSTLGIEWRSQAFRDALNGKGWEKLTDEFFEKQDQEKAAWREDLRETQPLGMLLKRELARKVVATREGKPVKISMRDLIISRFIKKAIDRDHAVMKLLLKIVPEKTFSRRVKTHVERPTSIEQGWLDEERKKGLLIGDARRAAGFERQSELGDRISVSQQAVSRWEAGLSRPPQGQLPSLASALKMARLPPARGS